MNVRQEVKYLGVVRADPVKYVSKYGAKTLKYHTKLPKFVRDIPNPPGLVLAAEADPEQCCKLYGDLFALRLIDLEREGIGYYEETAMEEDANVSRSPLFNNLSDLIERSFLSLTRDFSKNMSIWEAERLFLKVNASMGRRVSNDALVDFSSLLEIEWDGSISLSEFKRAFVSTI